MKHTKQNGGMSRRILAFAMTACMVTTSFSPVVSAQAEGATSNPILLCGFAELSNEMKEQSIPLGVSLEKLNLPDTLKAVVNSVLEDTEPVLPAKPDKPLNSGTPSEDTEATPPLDKDETLEETAPSSDKSENSEKPTPPVEEQPKQEPSITSIAEKDVPLAATPSNTAPDKPAAETPTPEAPKPDTLKTEPVTIHSVTWKSSPLYNENNPGTYIFTAVLPERYVLADGVVMPEIRIIVYDNAKVVGSWQWNDPEGYISEGVLALPGVNKENPVNLDALVSMLPTSILATLNASEPSNTPVPISLAWSSKDFAQTQDGSFPVQGEYQFTATMQEGYTLSANVPSLEITVRLGGAMLLPSNGTFKTLEIRAGTATGDVVVNLLDATSIAGNWALKPGADYYLYAELTAPTGAEHIQIHYGGATAPNGVTFANPPGGKYEPHEFDTHDYLDKLVSYNDLADPTYGPLNKTYSLQDGEMIYHIKKADISTNTVFAIGLVVKDAMYDGNGKISNAFSVAVGSYANNTFTPASDSTQTFDLKIAEKGKFNSFLSPQTLNAAIGEDGANGSMQYLANLSPDQPEILYDEVSFDLTYPTGAKLKVGLDQWFSPTHTNLGTLTVGDAVPSTDGKTQTVHVTVKKGLKAPTSHGACFVRLNFPDNAGFRVGDKYLLTTANVQLTMGTTQKDVDMKSGGNQICYTLSLSGLDETWMSSYDRIAYNHTIDAPAQSYLVPLGNAWIKNESKSLPTPYDKTFEAEYNTRKAAAHVSYITIPTGLNKSPTIEWRGVTADGTPKTGTIHDPGTYQNKANTFYFLPASEFEIVSFTGAKADIGALPAKFTSADGVTSWLFARDNLAGAYGYFTTDEPGIQVVNNYRLYNTDQALRDKPNGDLSATATGTSTDYCGIGWSGAPSLNGTKLTTGTTEVSINAGDIAKLSGFLYPYTAPNNGRGNGDDRGTATLIIDPVIYLTLPQGMSVVDTDLKFEIKEQDFYAHDATIKTISHQIENVSYLNTKGDGVSIYKITFPEGTRLGYFDEKGNQSQLYYTIPLLTSKSLETRRYGLSELLCITAKNQPEATKHGGQNQGSINYALADQYGINGGKPLGTFASEKGNPEGTVIATPIGFGVQQSSEINLYSAVSVTKIGGEAVSENHWYSYSSDPNSIALLGQQSEGRLRLQVSNTSGTAGNDLRIILPIPQKDTDLGDAFMDAPSGFTMSMTYDAEESNNKFTPKYIKTTGTYDKIEDKTNIVTYTECVQADANAVLFTATTVEKGEYCIYLDFTVAEGTPKSMDIWRPVFAYTVASDRRVSNGSYVASEVAASSISGVAFADVNRNGVQDADEGGVDGVTVVAKDEKNRIVSAKTDTTGAYQFLAIRESTIDMSFALSTEGQKMLRFNVPPLLDTATGIASTVTPAADGLTAFKTFTAATKRETVNAAVGGFVLLSYDRNGATGALPKTTTHVTGATATVARKPDNLAMLGHQFTGWNTEKSGNGTAYQPNASIQMSQNVILYAQWKLASYTVTFDYRGATGGNDEASREVNHDAVYGKLPTPAKNGYDFEGWCSTATGTKEDVTAATKFVTGADTTLYVLWKVKPGYTVKYNTDGGTAVADKTSVKWTGNNLLPPTNPTKAGYDFEKWQHGNKDVSATDTYGALAVTEKADITLKAVWTEKSSYTVAYNTNGGSAVTAKTGVKWTDAGLLPISEPAKTGYTFGGWYYSNTKVEVTTTVAALISLDDTSTILLTAHWSAVPGKVPDISGEVEDDAGKPVEKATVKLTQGSETKYGPVTTDIQGQYLISNLKPGIYNLVAEKGKQIVTVIVTVEKSDLRQKLILPAVKKNSVLDVQGSDTPPVVVGDLDEIAAVTPLDPGETSLTIKLTVQKEAEQTSGKPEHTEIRQTAGANADILFLDAVLTKQVNTNPPENIGKNNSVVLELVIPFDLAGKENIRVYRHHTDVDAFTALSAKPAAGAAQDETYYADASAGLIHVYAQKFSAYAIAFDKSGGGGTVPDVTVPPTHKPWTPVNTGVASILQTKEHIKYINGYADLTVGPERNMTRAEAAQMFYNLLLDKTPSAQVTFSDVNAGAWYAKAVNKLTVLGVFKGYADGTFGAENFITREEFCAIAMRFTNVTDVESVASFSDVTTNMWSYDSIMQASALGWVKGFKNGVFLPKNNITRSEVVTIVNNMLGRKADVVFVNAHKDIVKFTDLQNTGVWYYYDMVEASMEHKYVRGVDGAESWTNAQRKENKETGEDAPQ